jgi:hypothetical protein
MEGDAPQGIGKKRIGTSGLEANDGVGPALEHQALLIACDRERNFRLVTRVLPYISRRLPFGDVLVGRLRWRLGRGRFYGLQQAPQIDLGDLVRSIDKDRT